MFIIGIDPHRGSHTATVLDDAEEVLDELRVSADGRQRDRLLDWAAAFVPRLWAVEGVTGTGALRPPVYPRDASDGQRDHRSAGGRTNDRRRARPFGT